MLQRRGSISGRGRSKRSGLGGRKLEWRDYPSSQAEEHEQASKRFGAAKLARGDGAARL